jgi:hypothetical protein
LWLGFAHVFGLLAVTPREWGLRPQTPPPAFNKT